MRLGAGASVNAQSQRLGALRRIPRRALLGHFGAAAAAPLVLLSEGHAFRVPSGLTGALRIAAGVVFAWQSTRRRSHLGAFR
jgi:hypothetical protein